MINVLHLRSCTVFTAFLAGALALLCPALSAQTHPKPIIAKARAKSSAKFSAKKTVKSSASTKSRHVPPARGRSHPVESSRKKTAAKARASRLHHESTPQTRRLTSAFIASAQLRPMAQQLAATRSPAAYAGVAAYAASHPGEAASAAYLSLGHAYVLDHRYAEATAMYRSAAASGQALDDYADYLGAEAALQAQQGAQAYPLLTGFADRHPDSIFRLNAPVLLATCYLQQRDGPGALRALKPLLGTPQASHPDFLYALAHAYQISGDSGKAAPVFRSLYVLHPLTTEAAQSRQQLQAMGLPLSAAEQKAHADQLFNAKRYTEAGAEYHQIAREGASLSPADRDALVIYATVCDLKLKHVGRREIEKLPVTGDDSAALKLYMLAEISRTEDNRAQHDALISEMIQHFPQSRWLEEALYSGGNMYLLKHDVQQAIFHYTTLVKLFPESTYAPSAHWRAAWMNYRLRNYAEAGRMMEDQIRRYPAGIEVSSALFWRGRIFEDEEHDLAQAANFYRALNQNYCNFYYAMLARQRLKVLRGQAPTAPAPVLASVRPVIVPELTGELPENEPHLIKARLLANAALNEYIGPEIAASPTAGEWGALGQAEIFASYGEVTRSLQSMKHSGISFSSLSVDQVPAIYWHLLFPEPYWSDLTAQAEKNQLDSYLVASLIRQESEFNPGAVSHANAYGLMQLLPSVGKSIAKKQGIRGFKAGELLNPAINLQLGTVNLRNVLDRFSGQPEYALAAYNAGDVPVRQWMSSGEYKDVAEFVESIPYTETREYVQAILRNREMYRAVYISHTEPSGDTR